MATPRTGRPRGARPGQHVKAKREENYRPSVGWHACGYADAEAYLRSEPPDPALHWGCGGPFDRTSDDGGDRHHCVRHYSWSEHCQRGHDAQVRLMTTRAWKARA